MSNTSDDLNLKEFEIILDLEKRIIYDEIEDKIEKPKLERQTCFISKNQFKKNNIIIDEK